MKFDHLGVVVNSLQLGRSRFQRMLNIRDWTEEFSDPINGVRCQFGRDAAGFCYELLEPLGSASPVAAALSGRRAILNHVAYRVTELASAGSVLRQQGCVPTAEPRPAVAYNGRPIQFYFTPANFIIELIEAVDHEHRLFEWPLEP